MIINASIVKEERTHRGWTQQQLADVSGLSLRTIQRVENQGQGSMETCSALCSVLEMERRKLLEPPRSAALLSHGKFMLIVFGGVVAGFLCGVTVTLFLQ